MIVKLGLQHRLWTPQAGSVSLKGTNTYPDFRRDEAAFVGVVLGQSNAASYGAKPVGKTASIFQFWNGEIYFGEDPLYGTTGDGGSIWMHLGPKLLADHTSVLWAATAIGGTPIAEWLSGGSRHRQLTEVLDSLNRESVPIDAIFWIQGEYDAGALTSENDYYKSVLELTQEIMLRVPNTPIFVAKATRCGLVEPYLPIRDALDRIVAEFPAVRSGIDLDRLDLRYRYDGCHLTTEGLNLAAEEWYEILRNF